ncbi:MAG: rod shape-determining protein [Lachnospiraceae bacterium]|nr:rod shape-determining protein [Lachnospiraceae bacterium]
MTNKLYGIDFGTYAVKICRFRQGICFHQKSVIATKGKDQIIAIGDEAYEMVGKQPEYIHIDFPIRDGVVADYDKMLALINCIAMDMARAGDKMKGASFLIAVPTEVTDVEKKTYYDIIDASIIRPKRIRIVEKPLADAIGCGIEIDNSHGSLIVNIGADTTEISVISQGGIVLSRLCSCGGSKFDDAIIAAVRRKYNLMIGTRTAEQIKIGLVDLASDGSGVMKAYGRDYMSGLPREREITADLVNKAVAEPLEIIMDAVHSVLERIPPEISADIYRDGITFSGASSGLGGLAEYVTQSTGLKVNIAENGATSVADGLAKVMEEERYSHLAKPLKRTYYEND